MDKTKIVAKGRLRMLSSFFEWINKPAKPYEFWLSQSGVIGGVILGSILFIIFLATKGIIL